jgi:hypothetical protein
MLPLPAILWDILIKGLVLGTLPLVIRCFCMRIVKTLWAIVTFLPTSPVLVVHG